MLYMLAGCDPHTAASFNLHKNSSYFPYEFITKVCNRVSSAAAPTDAGMSSSHETDINTVGYPEEKDSQNRLEPILGWK